MANFKAIEMKLMESKMSNHSQKQNEMDFLLMPPPNMQMNTPMVLLGERTGRVPQSNATPFLMNQNSSIHFMDLDMDFDPANLNTGLSNTNGSGRNKAGSSVNADKVVYRTNGAPYNNVTNGHSGAANGSSKATNDLTSTAKSANNYGTQSNSANGCENALNAAKKDLFHLNNTLNVTHKSTGAVNGSSGTANSTDTTNDGYCEAQKNHPNALNTHSIQSREASTISNGSLFETNRFNGSTNHSSVANSIFGGNHGFTNSHQNISNERQNTSSTSNDAFSNANSNSRFSGTSNGLFGEMIRFANTENPSTGNNQHSNDHEKRSNASVFSRLNFNANNTGRNNAMNIGLKQIVAIDGNKQKNDAKIDHLMDVHDNGFDDDAIHSDDDEQNTNFDQNDFNSNFKATTTANQPTNRVHLFETAPFPTNNLPAMLNNRPKLGNFCNKHRDNNFINL